MKTPIYQTTLMLQATAQQVRRYVMTPERIMDYYPHAIAGDVIEPGKLIMCRSLFTVSLLELIEEKQGGKHLVVKVTSALLFKPPFSVQRIESAGFFSMVEDWIIDETDEQTKLTKIWRDIHQQKLRWLPLAFIVRRSANKESEQLCRAWNQAAESERDGD